MLVGGSELSHGVEDIHKSYPPPPGGGDLGAANSASTKRGATSNKADSIRGLGVGATPRGGGQGRSRNGCEGRAL